MASVIARALILAGVIVAVLSPPRAHAAGNLELIEQKIKAGLLYNFLKYTEWPPDHMPADGAPLVVCLLGGDPFGGHLDPMNGRTVNQHIIEVRQLADASGVAACSLLFVAGGAAPGWPALQAGLAGQSILTVSDFAGFAEAGGMIEFIRVDDRIGVRINIEAVTAAHLVVEDRLLRLASAADPSAQENE